MKRFAPPETMQAYKTLSAVDKVFVCVCFCACVRVRVRVYACVCARACACRRSIRFELHHVPF